MLSGRSIDVSCTAICAGPHNGDAGRVVDHGSEVGEDVPEKSHANAYTLPRDHGPKH